MPTHNSNPHPQKRYNNTLLVLNLFPECNSVPNLKKEKVYLQSLAQLVPMDSFHPQIREKVIFLLKWCLYLTF